MSDTEPETTMADTFATPATQATTGTRAKTTGRRSTKTTRGAEGAWVAMMKEELGPKVVVRQVWFRVLVTARWTNPKTGEVTEASHYAPSFRTREHAAGEAARTERVYQDPHRTNGWVLVGVGEAEEYENEVVQYAREACGVVVGPVA
jgi:hypothetical protein